MSAHVSAAISPLWLIASAQKISIFRFAVSRVVGQRCFLVLHGLASAAFGCGLCWHTAVRRSEPCEYSREIRQVFA